MVIVALFDKPWASVGLHRDLVVRFNMALGKAVTSRAINSVLMKATRRKILGAY